MFEFLLRIEILKRNPTSFFMVAERNFDDGEFLTARNGQKNKDVVAKGRSDGERKRYNVHLCSFSDAGTTLQRLTCYGFRNFPIWIHHQT
jgi:hypothetical protein